jgi:hypothetical protein
MELHEELRVQERKLDHLLELVDVTFETTDFAEVDIEVDSEGVCIGICLLVFNLANVGSSRESVAGAVQV